MRKYLTILLFSILLTSCTQQPSQVERDYIKNLEEKNRILEKELQEEKSKSKPMNNSKNSKKDAAAVSKQMTDKASDYFTIGSTEDEVLAVMGDPTSYDDMGIIGKIFHYGISSVDFKNGKVESYNNLGRNLKVKVKK